MDPQNPKNPVGQGLVIACSRDKQRHRFPSSEAFHIQRRRYLAVNNDLMQTSLTQQAIPVPLSRRKLTRNHKNVSCGEQAEHRKFSPSLKSSSCGILTRGNGPKKKQNCGPLINGLSMTEKDLGIVAVEYTQADSVRGSTPSGPSCGRELQT